MSKSDQAPRSIGGEKLCVSWKDVTSKQALSVCCHACGAAVRQSCELRAGGWRKRPHRARLMLAASKLLAGRQGA